MAGKKLPEITFHVSSQSWQIILLPAMAAKVVAEGINPSLDPRRREKEAKGQKDDRKTRKSRKKRSKRPTKKGNASYQNLQLSCLRIGSEFSSQFCFIVFSPQQYSITVTASQVRLAAVLPEGGMACPQSVLPLLRLKRKHLFTQNHTFPFFLLVVYLSLSAQK